MFGGTHEKNLRSHPNPLRRHCGALCRRFHRHASALLSGAVQARVSEALTLLPVLTPLAVPGVTIGCLITNAYGVAAGANILGAADILLGTAATLAAALLTRALRRFTVFGLPLPASLPPGAPQRRGCRRGADLGGSEHPAHSAALGEYGPGRSGTARLLYGAGRAACLDTEKIRAGCPSVRPGTGRIRRGNSAAATSGTGRPFGVRPALH